jgi:hypothetical protein
MVAHRARRPTAHSIDSGTFTSGGTISKGAHGYEQQTLGGLSFSYVV